MAASSVAWNSSTGGTAAFATSGGVSDGTGQNAHGALYQALFQVENGAFACVAQVSRCHTSHDLGQRASRHSTAVYTAYALSVVPSGAASDSYAATSGRSSPSFAYAENAAASTGQWPLW